VSPRAYPVHRTQARIRLRIPERRNDEAFFEELWAELDGIPEPLTVHVNPSTASVLLVHPTLPFEALEPHLRGSALFTFVDEPCPSPRALNPLVSTVSAIDRGLAKLTAGSADLRTVLFVAVVALAIRQLLRGELLGPAIPLLLAAVQIGDRISAADPPSPHGEAEPATE
jgi:hypothetical protein